MDRWLFTCEPGWEAAVSQEAQQVFPSCTSERLADGWVAMSEPGDSLPAAPSLALASQCLPQAVRVEAGSIANWARWIAPWLIDGLGNHAGPWRLHLFAVPHAGGAVGPRRCQLIEAAVTEILQKKQRRLVRSRVDDQVQLMAADEALVQIALTTPEAGFASLCLSDQRARLGRVLSRFPGGRVEVPANRQAPSRAFGKLAEVELRSGRPIEAGQSCVDLGSSPGSWAWWALRRGASVIAVDRSPLREDLMNDARLMFVRGDAFGYQPPQRVDWLLSDVIAFPERIVELLERWLAGGWCRFFCVTVKFRGTGDYSSLADIKSLLVRHAALFQLRRLTHNKNEVTAFGWTQTALAKPVAPQALAEPVAHEGSVAHEPPGA